MLNYKLFLIFTIILYFMDHSKVYTKLSLT